MKPSYFVVNFESQLEKLANTLGPLLKETYDGSIKLSHLRDRSLLLPIEGHNRKVCQFIKENFNILVTPYHGVLRNYQGNIVPPKGHVHVLTEALFSTVTCIKGPGTWVKAPNNTITQQGETAILVEPLATKKYPTKFADPIHHGAVLTKEDKNHERLVMINQFRLLQKF